MTSVSDGALPWHVKLWTLLGDASAVRHQKCTQWPLKHAPQIERIVKFEGTQTRDIRVIIHMYTYKKSPGKRWQSGPPIVENVLLVR